MTRAIEGAKAAEHAKAIADGYAGHRGEFAAGAHWAASHIHSAIERGTFDRAPGIPAEALRELVHKWSGIGGFTAGPAKAQCAHDLYRVLAAHASNAAETGLSGQTVGTDSQAGKTNLTGAEQASVQPDEAGRTATDASNGTPASVSVAAGTHLDETQRRIVEDVRRMAAEAGMSVELWVHKFNRRVPPAAEGSTPSRQANAAHTWQPFCAMPFHVGPLLCSACGAWWSEIGAEPTPNACPGNPVVSLAARAELAELRLEHAALKRKCESQSNLIEFTLQPRSDILQGIEEKDDASEPMGHEEDCPRCGAIYHIECDIGGGWVWNRVRNEPGGPFYCVKCGAGLYHGNDAAQRVARIAYKDVPPSASAARGTQNTATETVSRQSTTEESNDRHVSQAVPSADRHREGAPRRDQDEGRGAKRYDPVGARRAGSARVCAGSDGPGGERYVGGQGDHGLSGQASPGEPQSPGTSPPSAEAEIMRLTFHYALAVHANTTTPNEETFATAESRQADLRAEVTALCGRAAEAEREAVLEGEKRIDVAEAEAERLRVSLDDELVYHGKTQARVTALQAQLAEARKQVKEHNEAIPEHLWKSIPSSSCTAMIGSLVEGYENVCRDALELRAQLAAATREHGAMREALSACRNRLETIDLSRTRHDREEWWINKANDVLRDRPTRKES